MASKKQPETARCCYSFAYRETLGPASGIPVPPLDGSRIVLSLLPGPLARHYVKLERFGFIILLAIIFLLPIVGRQLGLDLNVFRWIVGIPLAWLAPIFLGLAGIG